MFTTFYTPWSSQLQEKEKMKSEIYQLILSRKKQFSWSSKYFFPCLKNLPFQLCKSVNLCVKFWRIMCFFTLLLTNGSQHWRHSLKWVCCSYSMKRTRQVVHHCIMQAVRATSAVWRTLSDLEHVSTLRTITMRVLYTLQPGEFKSYEMCMNRFSSSSYCC
jgi:hypothetical protein